MERNVFAFQKRKNLTRRDLRKQILSFVEKYITSELYIKDFGGKGREEITKAANVRLSEFAGWAKFKGKYLALNERCCAGRTARQILLLFSKDPYNYYPYNCDNMKWFLYFLRVYLLQVHLPTELLIIIQQFVADPLDVQLVDSDFTKSYVVRVKRL